MPQNVISGAILIIAGVIAAVALINALFPSIYGVSGSVASVSGTANDRMKTDARIICESLDPAVPGAMHVFVKNTGKLRVSQADVNATDVYFGNGTGMNRCNAAGSASPTWEYAIQDDDGDGGWDPGETLDVRITADDYSFNADGQRVKFILYNGASCEDTFAL